MKEIQESSWDKASNLLWYAVKAFFIAYLVLGVLLGALLLGPGKHASIGLLVFIGIISFVIAIYVTAQKASKQAEEARETATGGMKIETAQEE